MMEQTLNVGIIGDYNQDLRYHDLTEGAINHAGDALHLSTLSKWIPTRSLDNKGGKQILERFDALWAAPGDYRSMQGALEGIRFSRENKVPFLGTCGGFQHALLEYARNVMEIHDAEHEETSPDAPVLFITKLSCSLAGKVQTIRIMTNSQAYSAYKETRMTEHFVCNFGINPEFREKVEKSHLKIAGVDENNEIRLVELRDHPFFMATLYQPQISSSPDNPHPLIKAFLEAALSKKENT